MTAALIVVLVVLAVAAIALTSAWKTLEWLGDAEDLLAKLQAARIDGWLGDISVRGGQPTQLWELDDYKRRSPRRSS